MLFLNCFFKVSIGLISVDKGVEHFKAEDIVALHVRNNECMLQYKKRLKVPCTQFYSWS